jgi:hypothetical protein
MSGYLFSFGGQFKIVNMLKLLLRSFKSALQRLRAYMYRLHSKRQMMFENYSQFCGSNGISYSVNSSLKKEIKFDVLLCRSFVGIVSIQKVQK